MMPQDREPKFNFQSPEFKFVKQLGRNVAAHWDHGQSGRAPRPVRPATAALVLPVAVSEAPNSSLSGHPPPDRVVTPTASSGQSLAASSARGGQEDGQPGRLGTHSVLSEQETSAVTIVQSKCVGQSAIMRTSGDDIIVTEPSVSTSRAGKRRRSVISDGQLGV